MAVADGFKEISANGVQCDECGATVQPIEMLTTRHLQWHEQTRRRIEKAAESSPSAEMIERQINEAIKKWEWRNR